ncbi:glycosyltransferase family 2 protein [Spongiactinospora sp. TRM90649]|uniref:glycosyltransferase family 2 protein n=1 Tax=Spongiactinospora sp. TRM90649 TaxID=3031114 RepID=UPI0023F7262E|nr:glycosyltransferase family 2 protein [Spongiactinospora sp. TRM90649]MDF5751184.1 glycosyltransferase family 2 protein [Spongiactinospora sp. TRM90649]
MSPPESPETGSAVKEKPVDDPPYVTIVLPCYNEQDHVVAEVERICAAMDSSEYTYELIAVDDCSSDETLNRLREAAPRFPSMRVRAFHRNGGSGTVRRIGSQEARGEIVVWTDADMSYPNERIPELVDVLHKDAGVDQVVGARTTEEGSHKLLRVPAKWFIRKVAERLAGQKIPDLNSGLRAFRKSVARPYLRLLPPGFSCVTTITLAFLSNQHDVYYLPIEYSKRAGKSKFSFVSDAYRYILQVLRMVMYFNPLKVLMPPALWLTVIGFGKGVYDVWHYGFYLTSNAIVTFLSGMLIGSVALLADLIVRSRND